MAVLAAPVAHPDGALAMSWQERLAEMQQRKEQVLSDARGGAPAEDSESKTESTGNSYMDKISNQLSLKIQDSPGGASPAPAPEQEAPKSKKEESKSRFSFQQYDKDEVKSAPEATSKPPGDALPAPAAEPKEEKASKGFPFSFPFGKKDDAAPPEPATPDVSAPLGGPQKANTKPAEPSVSSPTPSDAAPLSFNAPEKAKPAPKADPAPAPAQADSKPWWERAEEVIKPDAGKVAEPLAAKKEEAKKPEAPKQELPKPAPVQKVEAKKEEVKKDVKKADSDAKGRKKTNGFALFASQMLMLGAFVGGTYALLFKSDALEGLMHKADDAILSVTEKK